MIVTQVGGCRSRLRLPIAMRRIVVRGERWADEKARRDDCTRGCRFHSQARCRARVRARARPLTGSSHRGEPVRGSWWSHPRSREIFAVTRAVRDSDDVLVCRLIDGKITFVHRRLWPALVRVADRLPSVRLSQLREVHTRSGRHMTTEVPFPDWVPSNVRAAARSLSEAAALAAFAWIE